MTTKQEALEALVRFQTDAAIDPLDREACLKLRQFIESAWADARDAERYRWLRECSPVRSDRVVTVSWPKFRNGKLIDADRTFSYEELDAAIDAALAARSPQPGDGT